ncbi:MAG TPA: hypothetical protein ENL00_00355 [Nitratifractor sp.]|nr:hypothetical protein [Nitratifractor sp.]HHD74265.1 hypothetical protein [Nitratifractor sp.]
MQTPEAKIKVKETDKWQEALDKKLLELQKCQREVGLESCFPCEKLLKCELRKEYIQAVYASMNKGSGGGFEF